MALKICIIRKRGEYSLILKTNKSENCVLVNDKDSEILIFFTASQSSNTM